MIAAVLHKFLILSLCIAASLGQFTSRDIRWNSVIFGSKRNRHMQTPPQHQSSSSRRNHQVFHIYPKSEKLSNQYMPPSSRSASVGNPNAIHTMKSVDWFMASGPLDPCEYPAGLVTSEEFDSRHTMVNMKRNVCEQATSGENRCACVRKSRQSRRYELQCGSCVDPCALLFQAEQKGSEQQINLSSGDNDLLRLKIEEATDGLRIPASEREDLKKLLMEKFFEEIID